MKIYGLTGGIGSGKSTVSAMFRARSVTVIDADKLAREAVEPGKPAFDEIVSAFGEKILTRDGSLDRRALADIIFADEATRKRLNGIVHPHVRDLAEQDKEAARQRGDKFIIYEVPLLFENNLQSGMSGVILVAATEERQIQRATNRTNDDRGHIVSRIRAQMPLPEKMGRADWVIDNNHDPFNTEKQVEKVFRRLVEENGADELLRPVVCHAPASEERPLVAGYLINPAAGFFIGEKFSRNFVSIGLDFSTHSKSKIKLAVADSADVVAIEEEASHKRWAIAGIETAPADKIVEAIDWLFSFESEYEKSA